MVGLIIKSFATSGGLFVSGGTMEKRGFYIVKDSFFSDMNESLKIIEQKARTVLALLKRGIKFMPTQPNVIRIYKILKDRINNND